MLPTKNSTPPKAMTWPGATPILVVAACLDLLRAFFEFFWFMGPAVAGLLCTSQVNSYLGTTVADTLGQVVAAICGAAATAGGIAAIEITGPLSVIMSDIAGLTAFLLIAVFLLMRNPRIFVVNKSTWLWLGGSLGVSVIPFIGALPSFFFALRVLYKRQIKVEGAALKKWQSDHATQLAQEKKEREEAFMAEDEKEEEARRIEAEEAEQHEESLHMQEEMAAEEEEHESAHHEEPEEEEEVEESPAPHTQGNFRGVQVPPSRFKSQKASNEASAAIHQKKTGT